MKLVVLAAAAAILAPAAVATSAFAQGSPSVDDLIRDLKPRADQRTRGIHAIGPSAPEPVSIPASMRAAPRIRPLAPPVASMPAASPTDLASTSMQVQFENGSDRLTPAAIHELDKLGRALSNAELASYRFRIEGHTDAVGSRDINQVLSERRAAAVVDYITSHYGVDRSRLTPVGMGFAQMAIPTAEGVPEPRNRRVQIVNVGA